MGGFLHFGGKMFDWSIVSSVIIGVGGWYYNNRRNRTLSRKQHTFNAILNNSTNKTYIEAFDLIRPVMRAGSADLAALRDNTELENAVRFMLNHYEFIAAAIRIGDIDERLVKWSERSVVIRLFDVFENYIYATRSGRQRDSTFEHLEWLRRRWDKELPRIKRCWETFMARPVFGPARTKD